MLTPAARVDHLVHGHAGSLPYYLAGCEDCQRLKARTSELVAGARPGHVVVYGYTDLAHRAGHLIATLNC